MMRKEKIDDIYRHTNILASSIRCGFIFYFIMPHCPNKAEFSTEAWRHDGAENMFVFVRLA